MADQVTKRRKIDPLEHTSRIVDPDGRPTAYFVRQWQLQQEVDGSVEDSITSLNAVISDQDVLKVRQILAGTGLSGGGTLFDADITLDLADTPVTPGQYGDANNVGQFTVDQQGRITQAANIAISGGGGSLSPPLAADFPTWVNQGSAAVADGIEGLGLSYGGSAVAQIRGRVKSLPSSPVSMICKINGIMSDFGGGSVGFMLRDSASSRIIRFAKRWDTGNDTDGITYDHWTDASTFSSTVYREPFSSIGPLWLKIEDDGVNFKASFSAAGGPWEQVVSESRTAWLASPDQIGFSVLLPSAAGTGDYCSMAVLHYEEQ